MMRLSDPVVFVVDDDEAVRDSLSMLMRSVGLAVETYPSALEFLDRSRPGGACLVVDVRMPGMTGLELQQRLASTRPDLPVVVITGHGNERVRREALAGGASAFHRAGTGGSAPICQRILARTNRAPAKRSWPVSGSGSTLCPSGSST